MIACYFSGIGRRDKVVAAFSKGCRGTLFNSQNGLIDIADAHVMMGFLHRNDEIVLRCLKEKRTFYHIDHAYFNRSDKINGDEYVGDNFRVTKNALHRYWLDSYGDQKDNVELKPWRKEGKHVVLCPPPTKLIEMFPYLKDWTEKTIFMLDEYTERPIMIKEKSNGRLVDWLKNAWCLISHNSIAAVESVIHGIPVIVDSASPAAPMGDHGRYYVEKEWYKALSHVEKPMKLERADWIHSLSKGQFRLSEMESGEAFRALNSEPGTLIDPNIYNIL